MPRGDKVWIKNWARAKPGQPEEYIEVKLEVKENQWNKLKQFEKDENGQGQGGSGAGNPRE